MSDSINGSTADKSSIALLVVDMFAPFDAPPLRHLAPKAARLAEKIATLRDRATATGIPTLYVNDNFGRWRSANGNIVALTRQSKNGQRIAELIAPRPDDYVILKPKHSAFFATPLHTLLQYMGARALILAGTSASQCILFTAMDAYVRDYQLYVPMDVVLSQDRRDAAATEYVLRTRLKAHTKTAAMLRLSTLKQKHARQAAK